MDHSMERIRKTSTVLAEIAAERDRQEEKFDEQNHPQSIWLAIAGEEFGEVSKEVCEIFALIQHDACLTDTPLNTRMKEVLKEKIRSRLEHSRVEWLQLAAVCVNAIESLDRNELSEVQT